MKRLAIFLLSTCLFAQAAHAVTVAATMRKSDAFLSILANAIEQAASEQPSVSLQLEQSEMNHERQFEQFKGFIAKGVDAIILNSVSDERAEEMQRMAADAKIPLIYVNRQPAQSRFPGQVSVVACNELVAGRLQMRFMVSESKGKGNVVILRGEEGHPAARLRTEGVKEVMAQYPDLKLVHEQSANWNRDQAEKIIADLLQKGTRIDIVAANNDEMAIGALRAFEKAGVSLDTVLIGGVDATPDAIAEMDAGKLEVTVLQNAAAQGVRSIQNAVAMATGGYAQEFDWIPWELVLPSNIENYK